MDEYIREPWKFPQDLHKALPISFRSTSMEVDLLPWKLELTSMEISLEVNLLPWKLVEPSMEVDLLPWK